MTPRRILILDDEQNICRTLRLILEHEGYAVSTASSLADAKGEVSRADAMLIDVRLPDGSGIDFLRQVRQVDGDTPA
ncbi:MAG: response regulator, partial [Bryobacteraceae bacterium]